MKINHDELIRVHEARKTLYHFYAQVFLMMPGDKLYKHILDHMRLLKFAADSSEDETMKQACSELEAFFNNRDKLSDDKLKEFDLETLRKYTSLLCLANSAPLYESVYTSPLRLVMQESRDEMAALMRKYNLGKSENVKEFEDHISLELSFMETLAGLSSAALKEGDNDKYKSLINEQNAMFKDHFDKWIDKFAENILTLQTADGEIIYRACTKSMRSFMNEDKIIISDLTEDI